MVRRDMMTRLGDCRDTIDLHSYYYTVMRNTDNSWAANRDFMDSLEAAAKIEADKENFVREIMFSHFFETLSKKALWVRF